MGRKTLAKKPLVRLMEWEQEHGYRSCYVADKLGIAPSHYSAIKHGRTRAMINNVADFSKAFGMPLSEAFKLFTGEDE